MSSTLVSLGLWYFLPNFVTGWVQNIYYNISYTAGDPKPQPGERLYARDRRAIFTLVIVAYLVYTVVEADWNLQQRPTLYQQLGVLPSADDRLIQSQMRKLAAIYHPDKVAPEQRTVAEFIFRTAKNAQEILSDPAKRFAYDRLGPDVFEPNAFEYRHCKSIGDFVSMAMTRSIGSHYLMFVAVMILLTFLNFMPYGKYWRWVGLASMATFECIVVSRPTFPLILSHFLNPLLTTFTKHPPILPFQLIKIIRTIMSSSFIAINQLAPWYQTAGTGAQSDTALQQQLTTQQQLLNHLLDRTGRLLGLELASFKSSPQDLVRARDQTKAWMVRNRIMQDPGVQTAIQRALQRRQEASEEGEENT